MLVLAFAATLPVSPSAQTMCSLTCPANMTIASLPGQQVSAPVNYTVPVPNGCSAMAATQTAGLPTGSQFAVGTTTNVWAALLQGGGIEGSCQFTVTVTATPAQVAPTVVPVGGAVSLAALGLIAAVAGAVALRRR